MVQAYLFFFAMIACQLRGKRFDAQLSGNEDDEGKTVAHSVIAAIRKKNELTIPFGDTPVDPAAAKLVMDALGDRKSVVKGTSVSVRVDLGGRLIIKKKKTQKYNQNNKNY